MTRTVLGLEIVMMLAGLALRSWTGSALFVYGLVWMMLLLWALEPELAVAGDFVCPLGEPELRPARPRGLENHRSQVLVLVLDTV